MDATPGGSTSAVADTATLTWDEGARGLMRNVLTSDGLVAGNWRLELAIRGKPAARADFTVAGGGGATTLFQPFVFASEVNQQTGKPTKVDTRFPVGVKALYVFSDYQGMQDGLSCVSRIYLNGQLIVESPFQWSNDDYGGPAGTWWNAIHASGDPLPEGEYIQELEVAGQVVQRGSVVVGSGAAATPTPAPTPAPAGVEIESVITDADTGRPIPGAFFIVLNPGVTTDAFQWTDEEVYTFAEADRQGALRLPAPLLQGACYSLIVGAKNYWPHTEDDVCIGSDAPAAATVTIQLQKR